MILDSTFVIDFIRGVPAAVERAKVLEQSRAVLSITVITVFEVTQGMHRAGAAKKKKVEELFSSLPVLPLDHDSAAEAGRIQQELRKRGDPIETGDCLIAGIALRLHEPVLTRNLAHFKRVPGLKVEEY